MISAKVFCSSIEWCVICGIVLVLCARSAGAETLKLDQGWRIQSSAEMNAAGKSVAKAGYDTEGWYATKVPSTVLAALVDNGVYPDPYYGENLKQIPGYKPGRWLAMSKDSPFYPSWWYRCEFDVPGEYKGRHLVLHLDGINSRANVWLNGVKIADEKDVEGMFRRFEFDVNEHIVPGGRNCLAVEVTAPGHIPDKRYRTKQLEATTGWDDHNPQPPDLNMGLWQDVYITATGPLALRYPYVHSDLELPELDEAHLTVSAFVHNKSDKPVTGVVAGKIEDIEFEQEVTLELGGVKEVVFSPSQFDQLDVADPRVWWPNNAGPQELYYMDLECRVDGAVSDSTRTRFGIRDVNTYLNEEDWRTYEINGRKILIRGGAWMTCDMLLRLTHRRYEALVRYAKEANLNMLRSEGFSIRETDTFYDLCDEYGVMVTQQLFGRTIPDEDLAVACMEDTLLRIRSHPSLVHFLGHDETFPSEYLDKAYRRMIDKYAPDRTYQPHSGAFWIGNRKKTGGTRTGSLQTWQYATPAHYYISRSTGAWGFAQSGGIGGIFATLGSMRRMLPEEALWPPWTDAWSFHTVLQGGPYYNDILESMNKRYGEPDNIEDFIKKGLMMNYNSARGMFEAYGRNKFSATGITTWKYDAAWPASPTWQYVDWYLVATGAYYGAKKACEPLHVQYSYDDDSVCVVNNYYKKFEDLRVTATVLNFDMSEKYRRTQSVAVGENGKARAFEIEFPEDLSTTHFLHLTLEDGFGQRITDNLYWLSTSPEFYRVFGLPFTCFATGPDFTALQELPQVKLRVDSAIDDAGDGELSARVKLHNSTDHLAFGVYVAVHQGDGGHEVTPTYWDDNYFSILPGHTKTIVGTFNKRDLDGNKPVLTVTGWNIAQ